MTISGKGGRIGLFSRSCASRGSIGPRGISQLQGLPGLTRRISGTTPIRSATPRHWTSSPALPSVSTQRRVPISGGFVRSKLDEIDLRILTELQSDGRMTNVELASRVGISPPPCLRRVRALEEAGVITGYRALLDERKLGIEVVCFAFVHLASQAEADLAAFQGRIRDWSLVRECWTLSGDIDFILKC
eukprot:gene13516-biopygen13724